MTNYDLIDFGRYPIEYKHAKGTLVVAVENIVGTIGSAPKGMTGRIIRWRNNRACIHFANGWAIWTLRSLLNVVEETE